MNIGATILLVVVQYTIIQDVPKMKDLQLTLSIVQIIVFILNLITMVHFYKMGNFYIKEFGENEREVKKFKAVVWLLLFVIVLSNFSENFLFSFIALLRFWGIYTLTPEENDRYWLSRSINKFYMVIWDAVRQLVPFSIGSFATFIIRYFASGLAEAQN